ncbi:hypothetical protein NEUTE1DRAFT_106119 [Neurospora tetrasperma FGSC 2508]|uniref:Uncharacterized protein n=1 Tax=Neurospora tetrasperma (strain FGSC 2508 / ATCC MYA-4615 / P0657) TaxID=510951 RepID=F8N1Q9_NEUT8|nr:uncharacterized protein NEUTE1DRAFT_106119 [Neurospora tetrasperma FGSC 2508]EGO53185.1 hypothetical protein NEUTE1DRAFT_106119 [Neurospora tetrasperma FGSC 2508]
MRRIDDTVPCRIKYIAVQPTPVTLSDGFPTIIITAISNLETVKRTRHSISGANEPLDSISVQADSLIRSLLLIKDTYSLQTLRVGEQIYQIMDLASRLGASMLVIAADSSRRTTTPPGGLEITPDDYVYGHLQTMKGQLQDARDTLFELGRIGKGGGSNSGAPLWGLRPASLGRVSTNIMILSTRTV